MKIIKPDFIIEDKIDGNEILKKIEKAGRTCYKSEMKISNGSSRTFVHNIIKNGHESVLEHEKISVKIICDRGVSHEIVRHRIASYSQESTRYCNYSKDIFGNEITFVSPIFWEEDNDSVKEKYSIWEKAMRAAEKSYFELIEKGAKPEEARSVLPNSLKTEIYVTMNLREWRHFFKLRTSNRAHPQMRQIALALLQKFRELVPVVFEDIGE